MVVAYLMVAGFAHDHPHSYVRHAVDLELAALKAVAAHLALLSSLDVGLLHERLSQASWMVRPSPSPSPS